MPLRRDFVILLAAFFAILAGAAMATASRAAFTDGTLVVRDGTGDFSVRIRGAVIGRIDRGKVTIEDASGATDPIVRGHERRIVRSAFVTTYSGKGVRFRILRGRFSVRIVGATGVSLSAVGHGTAQLKGAGLEELGLSNGMYSLNGGEFLPVPDDGVTLRVRAPVRR